MEGVVAEEAWKKVFESLVIWNEVQMDTGGTGDKKNVAVV